MLWQKYFALRSESIDLYKMYISPKIRRTNNLSFSMKLQFEREKEAVEHTFIIIYFIILLKINLQLYREKEKSYFNVTLNTLYTKSF